ncbi:MAG TPA: glycosyltransferase family 4 protein [Nitrospiria bacterium]|nr:glycosyltransferase family 4 protein [Nitrospiria bacterium]
MSCPLPLKAGGRIRVFNLLKRLATRHRITLLCLVDSDEEFARHRAELDALCERVIGVRWRPGVLGLLGRAFAAGARVAQLPVVVLNKRSAELASVLRGLLQRESFDVVQVEWVHMAQHVAAADRAILARRGVLVEHDVSWLPLERRAAVASGPARWFWRREARLMRAYEREQASAFRAVAAVSPDDAKRLAADGVRNVTVVPNGVDVAFYTESPAPVKDPRTLIFIGWMRHDPNVDGLLFFLNEVWPLIVQDLSDARLVVIGAPVPASVRRAAARVPGVELAGYVPDVRSPLRAATVSVVPLRVGGGTRLKILESMAAGTAVVSTSVGCEGLGLEPNRHLVVADDPAAFASGVVRLLRDPALRQRLERDALDAVRARYDWSRMADQMDELYQRVAADEARVSES